MRKTKKATAFAQPTVPKMVIGHYFVTFPKSPGNLDPADDYYYKQMLNPLGESNKHAAYGGFIRDVPLTEVPRPRPEPDWRLADCVDECMTAQRFGLNAFAPDILSAKDTSSPTTNWMRTDRIMSAADLVDNFYIIMMPDMSTGFGTQAKAQFVAQLVELIKKHPSVYRLSDGRVVLAPYYADKQTPAWWSDAFVQLRAAGVEVAFWPVFQQTYATYAAPFAALPECIGLSNWGDRNPAQTANDHTLAQDCHSKGKLWMQPVSVQDERPDAAKYDEAGNLDQLRACWTEVQTGAADWVHLPTWNDYSEGAIFAPSENHRYGFLHVNNYLSYIWKNGAPPAIIRNAIFLTSRKQLVSAKQSYVPPVGITATPMTLRSGSNPGRDTAEVYTILKDAGTILLSVAGVVTSHPVPAGASFFTVPLVAGAGPVATLVVDGVSVEHTNYSYDVTSAPYIQDLQYTCSSNVDAYDEWFVSSVPAGVGWAVPITPDPSSRWKTVQTEVGVTADGLVGNGTLTGIENTLKSQAAQISAHLDIEQKAMDVLGSMK